MNKYDPKVKLCTAKVLLHTTIGKSPGLIGLLSFFSSDGRQ